MLVRHLFEGPLNDLQDELWVRFCNVPNDPAERGDVWRNKAYQVAGLKKPTKLYSHDEFYEKQKAAGYKYNTQLKTAAKKAGIQPYNKVPKPGTRVFHIAIDGTGTVLHSMGEGEAIVVYDDSPNYNRTVMRCSPFELYPFKSVQELIKHG